MTAFDNMRFAVIDVESNGQQPPEIVEIAISQVDGLTPGKQISWLVKPQRPIAPIVTRKVHGIRNADVADAPSFDDIKADVLAALQDRTPIAHNASVEHTVLRRHMPDWSPATMLDTMRLARAVWPGLASYSLDPLLAHAGIDSNEAPGRRHRAGHDSHLTALLLIALATAIGDPDRLIDLGCLPMLVGKQAPAQEGLW